MKRCDHCGQPIPETHGVILHDNARIVIANGQVSDPLSQREYELVRFLVLHFGQRVTSERLTTWLYQNTDGPEDPRTAVSSFAGRANRKLQAVGLSVRGALNGDGYSITKTDGRQTEGNGMVCPSTEETWT